MSAFEPSVWWLPTTPTMQLVGDLSEPVGDPIELNVVGSFSSLQQLMNEPPVPIVHGLADGKKVTLIRLIPAGSNLAMPGIQRSRYLVGRMFVGAHIRVDEKFDEIAFEATFLPDWLRHTGIREDDRKRNRKRTPTAIIYRWPSVFKSTTADGTIITTEAGHSQTPGRGSMAVSERLYLQIKRVHASTADTLIDQYAKPLLDFVSFATMRANGFTNLVVKSKKHAIRIRPRKLYRPDIVIRAQWLTDAIPTCHLDWWVHMTNCSH